MRAVESQRAREIVAGRRRITSEQKRQALAAAQNSRTERGVRFGGETLSVVPAGCALRPPLDHVIIEPLQVVYSRWILVEHLTKPLRGIVKAIGPGHNPIKYFDANGNPTDQKTKRVRMEYSKRFQPTQIKVGDVVELGGAEYGGYAFEQFWWGEVLHLKCTERDICFPLDMTEAEARDQALEQPTR